MRELAELGQACPPFWCPVTPRGPGGVPRSPGPRLPCTSCPPSPPAPHSQVVRWFWEVVHSLDEGRKKRLLAFVTGSDRVPIKGLAHLNPPFVISRWGGERGGRGRGEPGGGGGGTSK